MAVTKIKPIRGTVNKALAYILDPKKTDDELYVSSYGCAASDAAAKEFEWTRNLAVQQGMQMPKVIARHLIQSFDVGEVTPEQAHEIGKQFADEWLKGKYEYVIATHIDISVDFCFNSSGCMGFLKHIMRFADDISFFANINGHDIVMSIDHYTHAETRHGRRIHP